MPPHVPQLVAEVGADFVDRAGGATAERALEVAVLHQCQRRVGVSADVIAVRVDGTDQLEPHRFRRADPVGDPEDCPPEQKGDDRRQQHADARLVLPRGFGDREVDDEK